MKPEHLRPRTGIPAVALILLIAVTGPGRAGTGALADRLADALARSDAPGASWGVMVCRLRDGAEVFATNAHRLMVPASNTKLFTVAAALDRLGPRWTAPTRILASAAPGTDGRLEGDLCVVGSGDTGFGGRNADAVSVAMGRLVKAVRESGVRRVSGDLVLSEGWFEAGPFGSGWGWEDLPEGYGAAVSSLVAYRNAAFVRVLPGSVAGMPARVEVFPAVEGFPVEGTVATGPAASTSRVRLTRMPGSGHLEASGWIAAGAEPWTERMAVPDPTAWFGHCLVAALRESEVEIAGRIRARRGEPEGFREIARVSAEPLHAVAAACLKPSDNLVAQLLLLQLGRDARTGPGDGGPGMAGDDEVRGVSVVRRVAGSAGIGPESLVLEEGSGLSRKNLVTAGAVVRLLRHMEMHRARDAWMAALPVGGRDGTLKGRFRSAPALGNVRAKTGTLRHVSALSGYVDTAAGDRLAFSILVNGYAAADATASARAEIDRLVETLAAWDRPLSP